MKLPDGTEAVVTKLANENGAIRTVIAVTWPDGSSRAVWLDLTPTCQIVSGELFTATDKAADTA